MQIYHGVQASCFIPFDSFFKVLWLGSSNHVTFGVCAADISHDIGLMGSQK